MVLYEMSNISCSFIGYDNVYIWIGINPKNHGRRIKISNKFNKFDRNDNFVLTIPDFKIIGNVNIKSYIIEDIKKFLIENNKLIEKYENRKITKSEFLNNILINKDLKFTMYSGISKESWNKIWKNKNLKDKLTNVTSDISFAYDYSYDFNTGNYDDTVIEISNIPINAFISYREDDYEDDDDFINIEKETTQNKEYIINNNSLFLVDLFKYKDIINIKRI